MHIQKGWLIYTKGYCIIYFALDQWENIEISEDIMKTLYGIKSINCHVIRHEMYH
jgi:hypothetical protein